MNKNQNDDRFKKLESGFSDLSASFSDIVARLEQTLTYKHLYPAIGWALAFVVALLGLMTWFLDRQVDHIRREVDLTVKEAVGEIRRDLEQSTIDVTSKIEASHIDAEKSARLTEAALAAEQNLSEAIDRQAEIVASIAVEADRIGKLAASVERQVEVTASLAAEIEKLEQLPTSPPVVITTSKANDPNNWATGWGTRNSWGQLTGTKASVGPRMNPDGSINNMDGPDVTGFSMPLWLFGLIGDDLYVLQDDAYIPYSTFIEDFGAKQLEGDPLDLIDKMKQ